MFLSVVATVAIHADVGPRGAVAVIHTDCLSKNASPLGLPFWECMP